MPALPSSIIDALWRKMPEQPAASGTALASEPGFAGFPSADASLSKRYEKVIFILNLAVR